MLSPNQKAEIARRKQQGIGWHNRKTAMVLTSDQSPAARDARAIDADTRERIKKHLG